MKNLNKYNILVSFNDFYYLRGTVMAENDNAAYKRFIQAPQMVEALKVKDRKILQYSICKSDT